MELKSASKSEAVSLDVAALTTKKKIVCRVGEGLVSKAVDALLKWLFSQKKQAKAQLLQDEEFIYLVIALKKVPDRSRTNPFRLPLPHPLYPLDGSQEICLIVNDLERGIKTKDAKEKISQEGIPVSKVIGLTKLRTDYFPHEAKRKLCGSYDLFLADDRILSALPKALGKVFFVKKKHPIPVTLTRKCWKGQIASACGCTFLYLGAGSCSVVKVARVSQSKEDIKENLIAAIEGVGASVPRKWANIKSLYLKTLESVALPLYQALPDLPLAISISPGPAIISKRPLESESEEEPEEVLKAVKVKRRKVKRTLQD